MYQLPQSPVYSSGEHITSLYSEKEDKPTLHIKGDLDVLNVDENEVIVVEIKD